MLSERLLYHGRPEQMMKYKSQPRMTVNSDVFVSSGEYNQFLFFINNNCPRSSLHPFTFLISSCCHRSCGHSLNDLRLCLYFPLSLTPSFSFVCFPLASRDTHRQTALPDSFSDQSCLIWSILPHWRRSLLLR